MQTQARYIEDEIDLRELILTLWNSKKFILIFTILITILSIIYVLIKTPVYEARATVELGYYMDKDYEKKLIFNPNSLSEELKIFFIEIKKNIKDKEYWVEAINLTKNNKNSIEILSYGLSNENAKKQSKEVLEFIKEKGIKEIAKISKRKEQLLKNINNKILFEKEYFIKTLSSQIEYTTKTEIPTNNEKISVTNGKINEIDKQIKALASKLKEDQNKNLPLDSTIVMKNNLELELAKEKMNLLELETSKQELESKKLPLLLINKEDPLNANPITKALQDEKLKIEIEMSKDNYKNSEIIGEIITNEYPIKPKKKLVVAVSFVTSFILSIFLVFFIDFIRSFRDEKTENSN